MGRFPLCATAQRGRRFWPTDLVVLDARDAREAFATRAPRRWVIRHGRLIAESKVETRRYFSI